MAKQLNVDMRFKADTSQAKKAIDDLNASLSKLAYGSMPQNSAINPATFEAAAKSARELTYHLNQAFNTRTGNLDLSKLDASLKASKTSLSELTKNFAGAGEAGQQAFVALAQSIAAADQPVLGINSHLATLWTTLKNVARFQLSSSIIHGLVGGLQSAYGYAQNLNQSLNNIRIVTGDSTEKMAQFARQANSAAKALSATTLDYTNASLIYYQQGLDDAAVKARTDVTVKLANVTRQSAEEVSNQMTAIWNNFDDGSQSMEHFADVITALGATTASSSAEIATGLERFAPIAGTIGLSYEKATAALATIVATTRQSAETVGTGLRTIFSRFESLKLGETLEDGVDLNKYTKTLQSIGVNVLDANGKLREMDDILDDIGAHWQQLDNTQRTAFATTVGGVRQYTNLIALFDNWDAMQRNLLTAQGADGALQKQADIYAESWEAASKQIRTSLQGLWDTLLNDKVFIKLSNIIADIISGVDRFVQSFGGVKTIVIGALSIIASMVANKIGPAFENIKNNIKILRGGASEVYREMQAKATTSINAEINRKDTNGEFVYSETQRAQLSGASKLLQVKTQLSAVENKLSAIEKLRANVTVQGIELQIKRIEEETNEYEKQTKVVEKLSDQIKEKQQALVKLNTEQTNAQKELTLAQNNFRSSITGSQYQVIARPKLGTELGLNDAEFNDLQQKITAVGQKIETQIFDTLIAGNQKATTIGGQLQSLFQSVATRNLFTIPQNADLNQVEQYRQRIVEVGTSFQELFKDNQTAVAAFKALGTSLRGASDPVALYNTRLQAFIDSLKGTTIHSQKAVEVLKKMKSADPSAIQKYEDAVTRLQKAEQALNATGPKTQEQIDKLQKEYNEAKQEADKLRASIDGLNGVLDKTVQGIDFSHKVTGSEALMTAAGAAGSLLMSLNMLNSVIDAFSAEDPFQGIVQGLSSLLFTLPMAINAWKSLATVTAWAVQTQTAFKLATIASNATLTAEEKLKQALIALKTKDADIDKIVIALKGKQVTVEELVKLGIKEENAERIVNTITTTANTVATESNTVAKIKNATATFLQSKVAKILLIAILAAIAAYKTYQKVQENIRQKHLDSANAAKEEAEAAKQDADSYNELADAWEKAYKANKDEESEENRQALKEATDDLIKSYGEELGYLAAAQENYDLLAEKIRQVREEKAALAAENAAAALMTAEIAFSDQSRKNAKGSTSWGKGERFRTWFGNGTFFGQRSGDEAIIQQAINQLQAEGKLSNVTIDWQTGDLGLFGTAEEVYEASQLISQAARNIDSTRATASEIYNNLVRYINDNKEMYELYDEAKERMGETTLTSALFNIKEEDITTLDEYNKKIEELAELLGKEFTAEEANNLAAFMLGQKFSTFASQKEFYEQLSAEGKASFDRLSQESRKIAVTIPVALFDFASNEDTLNSIIKYYQNVANNNKIQLQIAISKEGQNMAIAEKTSFTDWQTWANNNIFNNEDNTEWFQSQGIENIIDFLLLTDAEKEHLLSNWQNTGEEMAIAAAQGILDGKDITADNIQQVLGNENDPDSLLGALKNAEDSYNRIKNEEAKYSSSNDFASDLNIDQYKELLELQKEYQDIVSNSTYTDDQLIRAQEIISKFNEYGIYTNGEGIQSGELLASYNISPETLQKLSEAKTKMDECRNAVTTLQIALEALNSNGELSENWLTEFNAEAEAYGFNLSELLNYASLLQQTHEQFINNRKAALEFALAQKKLEKGFKDASSEADNFFELLNTGITSGEYSASLKKMQKALSLMFDETPDFFSDDWMRHHAAQIKAILAGDRAELEKLRTEIAKETAGEAFDKTKANDLDYQQERGMPINNTAKIGLEFAATPDELQAKIQAIMDQIPDDKLEVGVSLGELEGGQQFINGMQALVNAGLITQKEMETIFGNMGFDVSYAQAEIDGEAVSDVSADNQVTITDDEGKKTVATIVTSGDNATTSEGVVTYPVITSKGGTTSTTESPKGGGGGSKRKKKEAPKPDRGARYHEVDKKTGANKRRQEAAADAADRTVGRTKIKQLERQIQLEQKSLDLSKEKLEQARAYLKVDEATMQKALKDIGLTAQIGEDGMIANYEKIYEDLYQKEKELVDKYNKGLIDDDKFEEEKKKLDEAKEAMGDYEETLEVAQDMAEQLVDSINKMLDLQLQKITYDVEFQVNLNDADIKLLEHLYDKIDDDVYSTAQSIHLLGQEQQILLDTAQKYQEEYSNVMAEMYTEAEKWRNKAKDDAELQALLLNYGLTYDDWKNLSDEQIINYLNGAGYTEALQELSDKLLDLDSQIDDISEKITDKLISAFDELYDKSKNQIEVFDKLNDVLDHYSDIVDLTRGSIGASAADAAMASIRDRRIAISTTKVGSSYQLYQALVKQRQEYEQKAMEATTEEEKKRWTELANHAIEKEREAQEAYLADAVDALEQIKEKASDVIAKLGEDFKNAFAENLIDDDWFNTIYDRSKKLEDSYVQDYEKLYRMSELENQSNKLLGNIEDPKYRKMILDFQERVNGYKKAGVKISQNQIDAEQKWLDLIQARIDLENAQNAKSTVRLQRDNEGNWGYVYAADTDAIDDANAKVQKALYEYQNSLYNSNQEILEEVKDFQKQLGEEMDNLNQKLLDGLITEDQYNEEVERLKKLAEEQLNFYRSEYSMFAQLFNDTYEETLDLYNVDDADINGDFSNSLLGRLLGYNTIDEALSNILPGLQTLAQGTIDAWHQMQTEQGTVASQIDTSISDIVSDISDWADAVTIAADQNQDAVNIMNDAFTNTMTSAIAAVEDEWGKWLAQIKETQEQLLELVNTINNWNRLIHYAGDETGNNPIGIAEIGEILDSSLDPMLLQPVTAVATGVNLDDYPYLSAYNDNLNEMLNYLNLQAQTASLGFGDIAFRGYTSDDNGVLEQNVHIDVSFPAVTDKGQIEEAFENLVNKAAQFANRKRQG